MGLFDFAADFGKKLFGSDDDPADKIKAHIESDNPGVRNLGVAYDDGKVVLSGEADSADCRQRTRGYRSIGREHYRARRRAGTTGRILRHTEGGYVVKDRQTVSRQCHGLSKNLRSEPGSD